MKNFVKHTLAIAICAAALLSSCIKEQAYVTQDVLIDVTLTRAGTSSEQQGDQIEDIMLWAFELNGDGEVINDGKPIGWRQFTPPTTTYTSLNLHLPVKKCGAGGATYRLIAVLNRSTFTDASRNQIAFGPNTTYQQLTTGKFVSADLLAETPEEGKPGEPAVMPITHWADVSVKDTDVHATACAVVNIPVFRTVAKTQFFMACKSNQLFDVTIKELTLHCGAMPTEGVILSSLAPTALNNQYTTPDWFASTAPNVGNAANYNLYTAPTAEGAAQKMLTKYYEERPVIADDETAAKYYDLIGSHFIYETTNASTTDIAATTEPSGDLGYYYKIVYEADGQVHTYYTGIPHSILRNHDYQIHALVEGGSGELTFTIEVNQWTVEETNLDYQDIATINANGYIAWSDLPEVGDDNYHTWNYTNDAGQVVDNPNYANDGIDHTGVINLTSAGSTTAKFSFMLDAPKGGTWIAELRPIGGMANSIVFADGSSTMTGVINNELNELTIMNRADNLASAGGVENKVELRISAKGSWGGEERSYRVIGIAGDGFDADFNYTIIQPAQ
ncbi:MAG: hypothetical protein E7126_08085 [Rikenellaceae bacterium]|nr:hypothetical protein [Rikenellaceae bacterium]